ncbi:hypothetical protein H311_01768 [Anncaliia algerae PRA109]|nr:hypothetical protein H311_01768 [Anncaliia algerae PRA109]
MNNSEEIKYLIQKTSCDEETAIEALQKCNNNKMEAEEYILNKSEYKKLLNGDKKIFNYTGSKSKTATINTKLIYITYYSNGFTINDNFFTYDSDKGKKLKAQIDSGELNPKEAMINGLEGEEVAVEVKDKKHEFYGKKDYFSGEMRSLNNKKSIELQLPKELMINESNEVRIKVFFNSESFILKCSKTTQLNEFILKIKSFDGYNNQRIIVKSNDKCIKENELLGEYNGSVIRIFLE